MRSSILGLLALVFWASGECRADDMKKAYTYRLVIDVAKHRLLTDVFKEQLQRELGDGVRAALGKLATVEVTDKHDKLADIRKLGLQKALDGMDERGDYKLHFLRVDFDGTHYLIESRQYDAELGFASPVVRHQRTRDRAFVTRAAGLLLARDIGLVGTITTEPEKDTRRVRVEWRAAGLGDVGKWLKKGEVLAVVSQKALPYTLLQIETDPKDGVSTCLFYSRYRVPRTTGMRAILLGTRTLTPRLRLLEAARGGAAELQGSVTVELRRQGFEDGTKITRFTDKEVNLEKDGDKGKFDRVMFVSVLKGGRVKARMPVALLDDRPITIVVPADDESTNEARERYDALARNAQSAALVLNESFAQINKLTADPKRRAEAIASARRALQRSKDDYTQLKAELQELGQELAKVDKKQQPDLRPVSKSLEILAKAEDKLRDHVAHLEKIDKEENDPAKKEAKILAAQGVQFEVEGEGDKAIEAYTKSLEKFDDAKVRELLEKAKKDWKPASDAHAKARDFIYKKYPDMSTADLASRWAEVEKVLEECKNDRWGLRKLLRVTAKHRGRIGEEGDALKPNLNPDDEKPARRILELLPKLAKLQEDAESALKAVK